MEVEDFGDGANGQGSDVPMNPEPNPPITEGTTEPSYFTGLGEWTQLSLENQYVYTFKVKEMVETPSESNKGSKKSKTPVQVTTFSGEYVRKSVLGGFHPYAPLQPYGTANQGHDAYYVKVPRKFLKGNFNDKFVTFSIKSCKDEMAHGEDIYVSLRYMQALAENKVAWNPLHVLDLTPGDRERLCELDKDIRQTERDSLGPKKIADKAKVELKKLTKKRKNTNIPAITTPVQVKAVAPGFDFSERLKITPVNDIAQELGIYGVAGNTEQEALGRCLAVMHSHLKCKNRITEGDIRTFQDESIEEHIENCQPFRIFLKAVIPFRNGSGKLCFGSHSPFPVGTKTDNADHSNHNPKALGDIHYYHYGSMRWLWKEYWESPTVHIQPKSVKSRGWRTRYDSSPLSKPLIIWLLPGARTRFYNTLNNGLVKGYKQSDPAGHAREVFSKIISHINQGEKNNTSKKHSKLQLAPEHWELRRDYFLLSEDPFRLYQTYIHKDCVHEYMQRFKDAADEADAKKAAAVAPQTDGAMNLEASGGQQVAAGTDKETKKFESVRQLPIGLNDKYTVQEDEYKAKKTSFAAYWSTDPKATPVQKPDDLDEDEGEAECDSDEEENNPPAQGQQIVTTKTATQKINEEDTEPIETKSKETKERKAEPKKDMTRSIHVNPINAQKVIRAAGSRKGQKDQKAVMGFSASYFADKVLGWSWRPGPKATLKDRQMSNGLYIAEWLHMSAYSWGGIKQGTNASAQKSSQTKENLVFGTSEANSCMTRYEKAWQQLFKDEKLLRDKLAAEQAKTNRGFDVEKYGTDDDKRTYLQGELSVVCNTKQGPYLFDELDAVTRRYVWKERHPIEEDSTLAKLAEEFPFLAYNIRYEIRLMGRSKILAPLGARQGTTAGTDYEPPTILHMTAMFYPFSRRFYHRSEHLLDSALYQHMFMLGALNSFKGDRTLAEAVFEGRFKTKKLNDYKSWEKLSKAREEEARKVEALRDLDAQRQEKEFPLTQEAAHNLQDAELRYQQVFKAKVTKMKDYTSKAGYTVKWPMGKRTGSNLGLTPFVPKNQTPVSDSQGQAIPGTLKKLPGQPGSQILG